MGIDPVLFGPVFWGTIHYIALGAPVALDTNQQNIYKNFYTLIPDIIPCNSCGNHFREVLNNYPIDNYLRSSETLFEWTVIVHNIVNKKLNKPDISVLDARNIWMKTSNLDINKNNTTPTKSSKNYKLEYILIQIFILLVVLGLGIYIGKTCFTKKRNQK